MKDDKTVKKRRRYDAAFKANVLKLNAEGRTVSSLAASFGINENLIYHWKQLAKPQRSVDTESKVEEISKLRQENRALKQALKKNLAIFSRPH